VRVISFAVEARAEELLGIRSLCFQVPAVADNHGITVVISPLLCK
jgi:hypothetical protein